jgi:hypothetical protein
MHFYWDNADPRLRFLNLVWAHAPERFWMIAGDAVTAFLFDAPSDCRGGPNNSNET